MRDNEASPIAATATGVDWSQTRVSCGCGAHGARSDALVTQRRVLPKCECDDSCTTRKHTDL